MSLGLARAALVAAAVGATGVVPATAEAAGLASVRGVVEADLGASIPAADSSYKKFADPTFKFSLRGGAELWLDARTARHFGVMPEAQIDLIPVKTSDGTYRGLIGIDTPFGRFRFLFGFRALYDFGIGAAYVRFALGADYLTGTEQASFGTFTARTSFSSTAFTLEPGMGVHFRFLRYGIAGAYVGFPVAFHDFGRTDAGGVRSFTAVDVDLLATLGARF